MTNAAPTSTPYADAAGAYWDAGWRGILPLPPASKANPPTGWTGRGGGWPTRADVLAWQHGPEGQGNIGLRLPPTVVGVDVDNYGAKQGKTTLDTMTEKWGTLPPTWRTTSRDDGVSGIYLFTVPEGLSWPGEVGPGIEVIQWCHRYAVAWPSIHPEGRTYRWIRADGVTVLGAPPMPDMPPMPDGWVEGLTGGRVDEGNLTKSTLSDVGVSAWLLTHGAGAQCEAMRSTVARYVNTRLTGEGSRHDAARDALARLMFMASEGHTGAVKAVTDVGMAFAAATQGERRDPGEWERLYLGAVRLAAPDVLDGQDVPTDPCLIVQGATPLDLTFTSPTEVSIEDALAHEAKRMLDHEVRRQRAVRDARAVLDDEHHAKTFRVPPSRRDLVEELALPDEAVTFRVTDVLPQGANVLLTAQFKAGKTTLMNHLARCLADGDKFLGRYDVNRPEGKVALFNYEVGASMYRQWLRDLDVVNPTAIAPLNLRGYSLPLTVPRVQEWLVGWLVDHEVRVWVVDPFARAFTGESENDNTDVGRFLETLDVIKSRAGVAELVLPTHTGRQEFEVGAERARGATRLDDWADVRWMLTKDDQGDRYFSATGRDVEVGEFQLTYAAHSRALVNSGKGTRVEVREQSLTNRILVAIETTPNMGKNEIQRAVKAGRDLVRDELAELVRLGRVSVTEGPNRSLRHCIVGASVVHPNVFHAVVPDE